MAIKNWVKFNYFVYVKCGHAAFEVYSLCMSKISCNFVLINVICVLQILCFGKFNSKCTYLSSILTSAKTASISCECQTIFAAFRVHACVHLCFTGSWNAVRSKLFIRLSGQKMPTLTRFWSRQQCCRTICQTQCSML